jgi:hypothetical protein
LNSLTVAKASPLARCLIGIPRARTNFPNCVKVVPVISGTTQLCRVSLYWNRSQDVEILFVEFGSQNQHCGPQVQSFVISMMRFVTSKTLAACNMALFIPVSFTTKGWIGISGLLNSMNWSTISWPSNL